MYDTRCTTEIYTVLFHRRVATGTFHEWFPMSLTAEEHKRSQPDQAEISVSQQIRLHIRGGTRGERLAAGEVQRGGVGHTCRRVKMRAGGARPPLAPKPLDVRR